MPLDPTQPFQITLPDASHTFRVTFAPDNVPIVEVYLQDDLGKPAFTMIRPDVATAFAAMAWAFHQQSAAHRNVGLAVLYTLSSLPYAAPEVRNGHYARLRAAAEILTK